MHGAITHRGTARDRSQPKSKLTLTFQGGHVQKQAQIGLTGSRSNCTGKSLPCDFKGSWSWQLAATRSRAWTLAAKSWSLSRHALASSSGAPAKVGGLRTSWNIEHGWLGTPRSVTLPQWRPAIDSPRMGGGSRTMDRSVMEVLEVHGG